MKIKKSGDNSNRIKYIIGVIVVCVVLLLLIIGILFIRGYYADENVRLGPSESSKSKELRKLNEKLLENKEKKAVEIAEERERKMLEILEEEPALFLENVISEEQRNSIPEEAQEHVEKQVVKKGKLETWIFDDFENRKSKTEHYLSMLSEDKKSLKKLKIHSVEPLFLGKSGRDIEVGGVELGDNIVVKSKEDVKFIEDDSEVMFSPDNEALGEQRVAVILVNFADDGDPTYSSDEIWNFIFSDTNPQSINSFYRELSYGKTWFVGDVYGWYNIYDTSECNFGKIMQSAIEASDNDIFFPDYRRLLIIFPERCVSQSTVGSIYYITSDGMIAMSISIVGNSYFRANEGFVTSGVVAHELGHALGVWHANSLECRSYAFSMDDSLCENIEYGDISDVMGSGNGHMGGVLKEALGWMDNNIIEITAAGTYTIKPLEIKTVEI